MSERRAALDALRVLEGHPAADVRALAANQRAGELRMFGTAPMNEERHAPGLDKGNRFIGLLAGGMLALIDGELGTLRAFAPPPLD